MSHHSKMSGSLKMAIFLFPFFLFLCFLCMKLWLPEMYVPLIQEDSSVEYVPDWFMSPYFFLTGLVYSLLEYFLRPHRGGFLMMRDQEPVELILSLGFLLFVIINCVRLRRHRAGSGGLHYEIDAGGC